MTDAITIQNPRNRSGNTGHVLAKRSVTFAEIRTHLNAFQLPIRILVERTDPYVADPLSVHAASQRNVYGWDFKGSRTDAKLLENRPYPDRLERGLGLSG